MILKILERRFFRLIICFNYVDTNTHYHGNNNCKNEVNNKKIY